MKDRKWNSPSVRYNSVHHFLTLTHRLPCSPVEPCMVNVYKQWLEDTHSAFRFTHAQQKEFSCTSNVTDKRGKSLKVTSISCRVGDFLGICIRCLQPRRCLIFVWPPEGKVLSCVDGQYTHRVRAAKGQ